MINKYALKAHLYNDQDMFDKSSRPIVRRAEVSDLARLYEIEVKCFREDAFPPSYIMKFIRSPQYMTLVAVLEDKVVGFVAAALEHFGDYCVGHVYSIDVDPEYRRRGIGSLLLKSIEEDLRAAGAKACYLEAQKDNVAAINLYLKHGYKVVGTIRNYYGVGKDGLKLMREL